MWSSFEFLLNDVKSFYGVWTDPLMLQAAVSEPPQKWFDSLLCSNKNMAVHEFFISNFWIKLFLTQYIDTSIANIFGTESQVSNSLSKIN